MKKHILIVENFKEAHEKILNTNNYISWITEVDKITNKPGYYRKIGVDPKASINEWILWAKSLHEIKPIDIVLNFHENHQIEAFYIAEALGIDYINPLEAIENTINKQKMRTCLNKAKLDNTRNTLVRTEEGIYNFFENVGGPIVIKPIDGRGSKGVSIVKNKNDILKAVNWFDNGNLKKEYYLEEFLEGNEFSVEAFSNNCNHDVIAITQKFKDNKHCVEVAHCIPPKFEEDKLKDIGEYVKQALNALNIKNGVTHTEVILTKSGPQLVETHLRIGGDFIASLVNLVYDIDLLDLWVSTILEDNYKYKKSNKINGYAAVYFKCNKETGYVKDIKIEGNFDANIYKTGCLKKVGDYIEPTKDSFSRLAYAISKGESFEKALENAEKAIEQITFQVQQDVFTNK